MADAKLEKLKEQKKQIENRIRTIQTKAKSAARKAETRKKIVLGGAYLALEKRGVEITGAAIMAYIQDTAQDRDKTLFFPPLAADPTGGEQSEQPQCGRTRPLIRVQKTYPCGKGSSLSRMTSLGPVVDPRSPAPGLRLEKA